MHEAALTLLLTKDNELILQQRDNTPGILNPGKVTAFGGGVESGERPVQAAIRELQEELGLMIPEQDLRFWKTFRKTKARHGEDALVHLFVLPKALNPTQLTVHEGVGYCLVGAHDDLSALNPSQAAREFVADFFATHQNRPA